MKRAPAATFAIAAAALAMTVCSLGWSQRWLTPRFAFPLAIAAVGLPALFTLCARGQLEARPTARQRRDDHNRARPAGKAKGRRRPSEPAPLFDDPRRVRRAAVVGAAFAGWALLATILSPHPGLAILGDFVTANGAIFTVSLVAAWALGITIGRDSAVLLEWAIAVAAGANALAAIFQVVFRMSLFEGRAPGLGVNPVYLGGFLIGALWVVLRRFPSDRWAWGPVIVLLVAGIQLSGSRLAIVLLPVALVGAVVVLRARVAGLAAACVGLGLVAGLAFSALGSARTTVTHPAAQAAASSAAPMAGTARLTEQRISGIRPRLEAWSMAAHAIAARPIQGWGPGRFFEATRRHRTLRFVLSEGPQKFFSDAHNIVVEYATTTGLVGVGLLLAFVALAFRLSGWRAPLAGFALLSLATHLGEPLNAELTPLCFLALGAAAGPPTTVVVKTATWLKGSLIGVATVVGCALALGSIKMQSRPGPAGEKANLPQARVLLGLWSEPLTVTSNYVAQVEAKEPDAPQRALGWAVKAAKREPYRWYLWNDAGVKAIKANDEPAAGRYLRQATIEDRWSFIALRDYARYLVTQHRPDEARTFYERALRAGAGDPDLTTEVRRFSGG